jgi:predicted PurR-regulated permease PerM
METFKGYDAQEAVSTIVELAKSLNQISPVVEQFPEFIAHERETFLEVLQAERATILDSINEQRSVTLSEIESSSNRFLKTSMDQSKQLIDHLFIRAIQLLAAIMLCSVILVVLIFRLKGKWKSKID